MKAEIIKRISEKISNGGFLILLFTFVIAIATSIFTLDSSFFTYYCYAVIVFMIPMIMVQFILSSEMSNNQDK